MNKKQTEQQVNKSFNNTKPNVLSDVAAQCPTRAKTATATRRSSGWGWKIATCALALVLVVAAVLGGVTLGGQQKVFASVTLDVNPSISVAINSKERVVEVKALNADGTKILGEMDLAGTQLEVAVNAIIGAMVRQGYLSTAANSVLVSVDAPQTDYDKLINEVTGQIQLTFKDHQIEASVLSQWLKQSDRATELSVRLNVSLGKAQLIIQILDNAPQNSAYTEELLAGMTVNELNIIWESLNVPQSDDLTHSGSASRDTYIGEEAAKLAALAAVDQNLTAQDVTALRCKMDLEHGRMVYEVEFVWDGWEYDVDVDAISGGIVSWDKEQQNKLPNLPTDPSLVEQTVEQIKTKIVELLGLGADVRVNVQFNRENMEFEVTVNDNKGTFHEIELDIFGRITSWKKETVEVMPQPDVQPEGGSGAPGDEYYSMTQYLFQQLKNIHPNIDFTDYFDWELYIETERGQTFYEIEFKVRDGATGAVYEVECEVDYTTYKILRQKVELDD